MAAVLGLSRWESAFSLWHRKAGLIGEQAENEEMSWGKALEGPIAEHFARQHPQLRVRRTGTWRSKMRPWQIATPDRLAGREVLEIKTDRTSDGWGEPGTAEIPVYYRVQVLHQLDVLGLRRGWVAVLIGGSTYREYLVQYDTADIAVMREAGRRFIGSIDADNPPPLDDHAATYQAVRQLHPGIEPVDVEVPADLAADYLRAVRRADLAESVKRRATTRVLDAIGDGRRATIGGRPIAQRIPGRGGGPPFLRPARRATRKETTAA
jgi:putative phage-type endonuclease